MAHEDLTPGDVVYLRTGGPPMTLARLDRGRAVCTWFTGRGTASTDYALPCLTRTPPAADPSVPARRDGRPGEAVPGGQRPLAIAEDAWGPWCW